MSKKLKSYLGFILTAMAIAGYFYGVIGVKENIGDIIYNASMCLGAGLIIIWILGWGIFLLNHIKYVNRVFSYIFQSKSIILEKKEIEYEYLSYDRMKYKKIFTIKNKSDTLECFTDRYVWSKGNKNPKCNLQVLYNDTLGQTTSDVHWQYYTIIFAEPLQKNRTHKTGIIMPNLLDPKRECDTFASTGIFEPTKELSIKVIIPVDLIIQENSIEMKIYYSYNDRVPNERIKIKPIYDGKNCVLQYNIKYPLKNAKYKLEWKFS